MNLVASSRRRAAAIWLLLLLLAAGGAYQATRMPSSIFPSVTFPLVKVIGDVGEQPALQMMPTVTRPLEEALLRVPGTKHQRNVDPVQPVAFNRVALSYYESFNRGTNARRNSQGGTSNCTASSTVKDQLRSFDSTTP